jgi:phage/plasmid-associated DNA primase
MATDIVQIYLEKKRDIADKQCKDKSEMEKDEKKEKKCRDVITALKSCAFQDRVLKMCKIQFYDPHFMKKLNENRMLWGCENGVLDLENYRFREGHPDDYISFSCGLDYREYTDDDDEVKEINEFFGKVLINKNIRDYFIDSAACCMEGGNINKTFLIATGDGHNAKSVTFSLLELTFGDYCIKFPRELFIMGRGSNPSGPRPELARVRGRRLGMGQEIAKTETMNIGVIKEMTGNDSFFARGMYEKDAVEIRPMFSLMMQVNDPPKVPGHDEATWNRITLADFESKFILPRDMEKYPVPESEEEQYQLKRFKADLTFSKRLPDLAPVFLWMLFRRRRMVKESGGLKTPEEVKSSTDKYKARNDVYLQFYNDMLQKAPKPKGEKRAFLKLADLHAEFQNWYVENHSSYAKERFTRITLLHEFSKKLGPAQKVGRDTGWYDYAIIQDTTDEEENQQQVQALMSQRQDDTK